MLFRVRGKLGHALNDGRYSLMAPTHVMLGGSLGTYLALFS
jgi:hypothetical protein